MIIKTSYVADDGKPFDTEEECVAYEKMLNAGIMNDVQILNRTCKFFTSTGREFQIDSEFKESEIYGARISCTPDEVEEVCDVFQRRFDDLHFALSQSDFALNSEAFLVYDWTGSCSGWGEIDYDTQEFLRLSMKVMGWE